MTVGFDRSLDGLDGLSSVKFRADLRQPPLVALSNHYPFQARVTASTGEAQTLTGEVVARPRLPVWIIPVALVLVLACIGGTAALYSGVVQSARRQQASQTASAEQAQAAALLSLYKTRTAEAAVAVSTAFPAAETVIATDIPIQATHTSAQHLQETATPPPPPPVPAKHPLLAFASNRDGNWEVYVMNADGSQPVNLTENSYDDQMPYWGNGNRFTPSQ